MNRKRPVPCANGEARAGNLRRYSLRGREFRVCERFASVEQCLVSRATGRDGGAGRGDGGGKSTLVICWRVYTNSAPGRSRSMEGDPRFGVHAWREMIGMGTQESFLFNGRSAKICSGKRMRPMKTARSGRGGERGAFIEAAPERTWQRRRRARGETSVGEKQRLSIARALLKDPPI